MQSWIPERANEHVRERLQNVPMGVELWSLCYTCTLVTGSTSTLLHLACEGAYILVG